MSLLRLLTTGRSLVGLEQGGNRYHLTDQRWAPKFDAKQNPFRATTKPDSAAIVSSRPAMAPAVAAAMPATPATLPAVPVIVPAAPAIVPATPLEVPTAPAANAEDLNEAEATGLAPVAAKTAASTASSAPQTEQDNGLLRSSAKQSPPADAAVSKRGWMGRWLSKLDWGFWHRRPAPVRMTAQCWYQRSPKLGWPLWGRRVASAQATMLRLAAKPLVQGELSLDSIKVVRNDLSDSDLEIVPAGQPKVKKPEAPALATAAGAAPVLTRWNRVSSRLFGAGKTTT